MIFRRILAWWLVAVLAALPVVALPPNNRMLILTPKPFTYYVDSVRGNDSNNGNSPAGAWANLTKVPALKPGQSVGLARGSSWSQALTAGIPGTLVNNVTIAAYGYGAAPSIDASAPISAGCWALVVSYYVCTITGPGTSFSTPYGSFSITGPWVNFWECKAAPCTPTGTGGNETYLKNVSSAVSVVAGTYYIVDMTAASIVIDMLPSDGSNPGTNGFVYTYSLRPYGIEMDGARGNKIIGVAAKKNADNNGSIIVNGDGSAPLLVNDEADQGGKHNMFVPGGATVVNAKFVDEYFTASGNMFVAFDQTGSGKPVSLINPTFLFGVNVSNNSVTLETAHTGSSTLGAFTVSGGYAKLTAGAGLIGGFSLSNSALLEVDNFVFDGQSGGSQLANCSVTNCVFNNDQYVSSLSQNPCINAGANSVTLTVTGTKCCVGNVQQGALRNSGNTSVSWVLTNNTIYLKTPNAGSPRALVYGSVAETVSSNGNVFDSAVGLNPGTYDLPSTSTYTGDNNAFVASNASVLGLLNGVQYNTLAAWKSATSQDTNSVTTGSGSSACTIPAGE